MRPRLPVFRVCPSVRLPESTTWYPARSYLGCSAQVRRPGPGGGGRGRDPLAGRAAGGREGGRRVGGARHEFAVAAGVRRWPLQLHLVQTATPGPVGPSGRTLGSAVASAAREPERSSGNSGPAVLGV